MPFPVTRDDFKAVIPDPSSDICYAFKQVLLKLPELIWKFVGKIIDENGDLLLTFREDVSLIRPGDLIFSARVLDVSSRLLCNGAAVSRTTYATLYLAIGDLYGAGDGSTTFNVPNYQDRFPIGAGLSINLAQTGGLAETRLDVNHIPQHNHGLSTLGKFEADGTDSVVNENLVGQIIGVAGAIANTTDNYGTATPTPVPTVPPFIGCFIYIKT